PFKETRHVPRFALKCVFPRCLPVSGHVVICPSCVDMSVPVTFLPVLVRSATREAGDCPASMPVPVQCPVKSMGATAAITTEARTAAASAVVGRAIPHARMLAALLPRFCEVAFIAPAGNEVQSATECVASRGLPVRAIAYAGLG